MVSLVGGGGTVGMGSGGGCHGVRQRRDFPMLNKQNDASVVWGCGEHLCFIQLVGGAELSKQIQSITNLLFHFII